MPCISFSWTLCIQSSLNMATSYILAWVWRDHQDGHKHRVRIPKRDKREYGRYIEWQYFLLVVCQIYSNACYPETLGSNGTETAPDWASGEQEGTGAEMIAWKVFPLISWPRSLWLNVVTAGAHTRSSVARPCPITSYQQPRVITAI